LGCRVDEFRGIIDLLSFLIDNDRFDVVDKLGNALSERIALEALYEALRVAKSMGEVQLPARREIERFVECLRDPSEFYRVTRYCCGHCLWACRYFSSPKGRKARRILSQRQLSKSIEMHVAVLAAIKGFA